VLTLAAFGLRLAALAGTGALEPPPGRWEHGYEVGAVAVALSEGRGFADPFLSRTGPTAAVGPALPALWALLVLAFGPYSAGAWAGFLVLNAAFSALCVPAAAALGRRCGGPVVGLVAAVAWTVHPVGVFGPTTYQGASGLFALFVTLTIERVVALEQADGSGAARARPALQVGAWLGLGLWVEPLLLPAALLWLLVTVARRRWALARAALLGGALAAALAAPWLVRNALVFEEPVFLRSWAGPELLLGAAAGPGEPTPVGLHPSRDPEQMRRLIELGEPAYAREQASRAFELIAGRPAAWSAAVGWRWTAFWLGRLAWWRPAPDHPSALGALSALRGSVHAVPALLAAAGLWRVRRLRPASARVLAVLFLAYPVTYALTHVEARYRHPLEPTVTVAAALLLAGRGGPEEEARTGAGEPRPGRGAEP
jgi:hypothetical protein